MSENSLEAVQTLLRNFQKAMMAKSSTIRGQWNAITCLEQISQVQFARRMNAYGVPASNFDVAQLFYYLGIKKNSLGFNDFMTLMETDPATLGPKTRRLSQAKDIQHETLRAFDDDFNKYCRRTTTFTPSTTTRSTITQKSNKKITRPITAPKSSTNISQSRTPRKQKNAIRTNSNRTNSNHNDESQYASHDDDLYITNNKNYNQSNGLEDCVTFSYEPCKAVLERSLPRDVSTKQAREATLRSFSNTAIQRQYYDGTDRADKFNRESGMPINELVTKISDIAYTAWPNSWTCFLKWRDPHHDLLDANDLRNGLKHDNNFVISQADAQKVIDKYGGPMNHSSFAVMLHDGSHFNPNLSIGYNDI